MPSADVVIHAIDAAPEQREEAVHGVAVDVPAHVFILGMVRGEVLAARRFGHALIQVVVVRHHRGVVRDVLNDHAGQVLTN